MFMSEPLPEPLVLDAKGVDIAELFREHGATVARWAARLGGPGVEVEDVVQEVFMVASRRLDRFEPNAKITTWLFRVTERVVYAFRRSSRMRRRLARLPSGLTNLFITPLPEPADQLNRNDASRLIYACLDKLPENHRRVLILFQMEELSTDQIAELLDVKPTTVRVWLHRARSRFIELYESFQDQDDAGLKEVP